MKAYIAVGDSYPKIIIPETGTMIDAQSSYTVDRFFSLTPNFGDWEYEYYADLADAASEIKDAASLRTVLLAAGWHRFTAIVAEHDEGQTPIIHCKEWWQDYQRRKSWFGGIA